VFTRFRCGVNEFMLWLMSGLASSRRAHRASVRVRPLSGAAAALAAALFLTGCGAGSETSSTVPDPATRGSKQPAVTVDRGSDTSTAPDPTARGSTQLVVTVDRGIFVENCLGYRLLAVAGGRERLLSAREDACKASLAPDGRHVAYLALDRGVPTLFVEKVGGGSRRVIAACTSDACDPDVSWPSPVLTYAWSPGGDRLAYTTGNLGPSSIRVASLTGEVLADVAPEASETKVAVTPEGQKRPLRVFTDVTWSPLGDWLSVVEADRDQWDAGWLAASGVNVVRADGSGWRRLIRTRYGRPHMSWPTVSWAPDQPRLFVMGLTDELPVANGVLFAATGQRLWTDDCRRSAPLACPGRFLGWSPNGRQVAFARERELIVATRDMKRVIHRIGGISVGGVAWSPDSRRLAYVERDLTIVTLDGKAVRHLDLPGTGSVDLWSPDGRWIALTRLDHEYVRKEVVIVSTEGGNLLRAASAPRGDWEITGLAWQTVAP
jgi:Tol biopolymer transport system component